MPPEAITSPSGIWSTEIERSLLSFRPHALPPSHFGHLHCVVKKFGHTLKFSFNLFNPAFRVFQFGWLKGGPNLYFSTCLRKEYLYLCDFELDFELEKSVYICVCSLWDAVLVFVLLHPHDFFLINMLKILK